MCGCYNARLDERLSEERRLSLHRSRIVRCLKSVAVASRNASNELRQTTETLKMRRTEDIKSSSVTITKRDRQNGDTKSSEVGCQKRSNLVAEISPAK